MAFLHLTHAPEAVSAASSHSSAGSTFWSPQVGCWHTPPLQSPTHDSPSVALTKSTPHESTWSPRHTLFPDVTPWHSGTILAHSPEVESHNSPGAHVVPASH